MKIPLLKALIFDFDGVIVDSIALHEKTESETYRYFNINVPEEGREQYRGQTLREIFVFISQQYGTGEEDIDQMVEYKRTLSRQYRDEYMTLVPGVERFLEKVTDTKKYRLAIGTAGIEKVQSEIMEGFGITSYFDLMVTADDVQKGKPDPEIYTAVVQRLGLQPKECLVIEDAVNGIMAAKAAGCMACGITTGMAATDLANAGADVVVDSFEELWQILEKD